MCHWYSFVFYCSDDTESEHDPNADAAQQNPATKWVNESGTWLLQSVQRDHIYQSVSILSAQQQPQQQQQQHNARYSANGQW